MEARGKIKFVLTNKTEELSLLSAKMEMLGELWELPGALTMNLNLVLEEAISNIIFYAFSSDDEQKIDVIIDYESDNLSIRITDTGKPFDPTSQIPPDITLPTEERNIGGLGIFLINKLMDSVSYSRDDDMNILILNKNLK